VLTATSDPESLSFLLEEMFDPTAIAPQHIPTFLQGIAANEFGLPLVNHWLQSFNHFTRLQSAITNQATLANTLRTVLALNTDQADITALTTFFAGQQLPPAVQTAVTQGLATAADNVRWLYTNYQPILTYLQSGVWRNSSITPTPPTPSSNTPWLNRRLPSTVMPVSTVVDLSIDLDSSPPSFHGWSNLTVKVTAPTNYLVIHAANNLAISRVLMMGDSGLAVPLVSWSYTANQYLVLNFSTTVAVQQSAQLQIQFSAPLTAAPLSGLYLAYYTNSTGQRVNMATTQFESIGARRAFPCFDEPAFKSTFTITIHAAARYPTVLSNMNVVSQTPTSGRAGWLTTTFAPTVVMSSYLVAMVVSDYQYTEEVTQCGSRSIPTRVYAPAHRMAETKVPARIAAAQIAYYCSYFAIEYPLPKEDHIYIPQFGGAMENWGLITSVHVVHTLNPSSAPSSMHACHILRL